MCTGVLRSDSGLVGLGAHKKVQPGFAAIFRTIDYPLIGFSSENSAPRLDLYKISIFREGGGAVRRDG